MMLIQRVSPLSGKRRTKEINVTPQQLHAWHNGQLIQEAMPNISADDREFVKTGITAEEWAKTFASA